MLVVFLNFAFTEQCRYEKGPWSECDPKTNLRARTLKLKKKTDGTDSQANCEPTKTIQKKCKKGNKNIFIKFYLKPFV